MHVYTHTYTYTHRPFKMTISIYKPTFPFIVTFQIEPNFCFCSVENHSKYKSEQRQVTECSAAELTKALLGGSVASENPPCTGLKSLLASGEVPMPVL